MSRPKGIHVWCVWLNGLSTVLMAGKAGVAACQRFFSFILLHFLLSCLINYSCIYMYHYSGYVHIKTYKSRHNCGGGGGGGGGAKGMLEDNDLVASPFTSPLKICNPGVGRIKRNLSFEMCL